jgi:hypothetical protein
MQELGVWTITLGFVGMEISSFAALLLQTMMADA